MGILVCPQVICWATQPLSLRRCCRGLTSPRYSTRSCVALVETCYCRTTCRRTGRRRASTFASTAPRVCPRWWLDWWRTSRRRSPASPRTSSTKASVRTSSIKASPRVQEPRQPRRVQGPRRPVRRRLLRRTPGACLLTWQLPTYYNNLLAQRIQGRQWYHVPLTSS